jgi:ribose transport system permease protein
MVLAMSLLNENFLTAGNLKNILQNISINVCLATGMTLVILTGGIDLSVGSVLALSGAVTAWLLRNGIAIPWLGLHAEFTVSGAVCGGLGVGLALGAFNGLAVTRFRIPPFVATLGMFSIARGLTQLLLGGPPITKLGPRFAVIGTGFALGIPMSVWIAAAMAGAFVILSCKTRFGRHIYAVGGNERAALLSGLRVNRIKLMAYALGGVLAAVGGVILTSQLNSATVEAGMGYELSAIAAVVIGGASLSGGKGSVFGTVLGCLIVGVLSNSLILLKVHAFWQEAIKGAVILVVVAIDRMNERRS